MPALGMQAMLLAMLLVLWGLGWGGSCLVWGWAWMMETMRWPAGVRMGLVVGRSRELLQAALGRRWNCGGSNISLVMILSVDAAMRVEAASSVLSAEGGCWVTACRVMRSPARPPAGAWDAGVSDLIFSR